MLSAARLAALVGTPLGHSAPAATEGRVGRPPGEVGADGRRRDRLDGLDGQPPAPSPGPHNVVLPRPPGRVGRRPCGLGAPSPSPSWPSPGSVPGSPSRDYRRWAWERSVSAHWWWPRWQWVLPAVLVAEGAVSVVVGLMVGASRRQYVERTFQAEQLLAERVRADAERDRAAALAERNRIGREVHDVLAHSLGALSVQLDAADALLENGDDSPRRDSWSNRLGGSPSRGWRRRARPCTHCATSRWLWPSNWRRWPPVTAPS